MPRLSTTYLVLALASCWGLSLCRVPVTTSADLASAIGILKAEIGSQMHMHSVDALCFDGTHTLLVS